MEFSNNKFNFHAFCLLYVSYTWNILMYFIIFKPEHRYRMYNNQIFLTEEDALEFAKKSFKRKDKWRVVDYDNENYNKYWK